jgi:beta-lactamase class A
MDVASGLLAALVALSTPYQGKVAVYATDLTSGREVALNADTAVPTASVIKLAILFEALKQVQEGRVRFADTLTMTKPDQVAGSGVLSLFDTPMRLTLKDALTMMIATSDNTGTNLVIDHLGLASVDSRITWMGLKDTWLYKKVFMPPVSPMPADQKQFGLGKTTAREMAAIMTRFATCNLNAPASAAPSPPSAADRALCDAAISMLKHQTDGNSIPRYLTGVDVANKTGSLDDVRNDVAIVYAKNGPIVISAFTYANADQSWTPDNAGALLIGKMAKTIVDAWQ